MTKFFGSILILFILFSCVEKNEYQAGICLSFDDNYLEDWVAILPLLEKYDAKVTFFLTGVGNYNEQEKKWLQQLVLAGHDIGAHGELHVSAHQYIQEYGFRKFWTDEVEANIVALKNLGISPTHFAYPYGERNKLMDFMLWMKFKATRNVASINSPKNLLEDQVLRSKASFLTYSLSIDESELSSLEQINSLIERAKSERKILFLHAHGVGESGQYSLSINRLDSLLKMGAEHHIKFISFGDL